MENREILSDAVSNNALPILETTLSYQCQVCYSDFSDSRSLRTHMMKELGILPELVAFLDIDLGIPLEEEMSPATSSSETEIFKCDICDKVCRSERGLHQHIGKIHSRKAKPRVALNLKPEECQLCGKPFSNKRKLSKHLQQFHSN